MRFFRISVFLISITYQGKSDKIEKMRCYCNLEECVSNNFLCLHEDIGCFSDFMDYRDITQAKHGCLGLLKSERLSQCGNAPGSQFGSSKALLLCCKTDLCNQILGPASLFTHSIIESLINATGDQNKLLKLEETRHVESHRFTTNEVWFKVTTIVVPICGAMILLLLVALAFRILRADYLATDKYCGKTKNDASFSEAHIITYKTSELNSNDLSKKIPLLYEMRQNEAQNSENFRQYTTARIHFGQNVNALKNANDSYLVEKNVENQKINRGKLKTRQKNEAGITKSIEIQNVSVEDKSTSTFDVKVGENNSEAVRTLSFNLDKPENLSNCNLYRNLKAETRSCLSVIDLDKMYDKYLL